MGLATPPFVVPSPFELTIYPPSAYQIALRVHAFVRHWAGTARQVERFAKSLARNGNGTPDRRPLYRHLWARLVKWRPSQAPWGC